MRLASQSATICGNISPLASEMASITTASENLAQVSAPIISFHIVLPKSCLLTGPTPRHPGKGTRTSRKSLDARMDAQILAREAKLFSIVAATEHIISPTRSSLLATRHRARLAG